MTVASDASIAALTAELDMVVSVPQAIVHLAGGLGKEVIVLKPEVSRWFYYQTWPDRPEYSIWYPNVKMLEQRKGEWPIRDVAKYLESRTNV
jgi:ADP-heptose:LPS heptosyltransferase